MCFYRGKITNVFYTVVETTVIKYILLCGVMRDLARARLSWSLIWAPPHRRKRTDEVDEFSTTE